LSEPERILKGFWELCRPGGRLLLTDVYRKNIGLAPSAALFSRWELENALYVAGWRVTHFEDCSRALKEFAAGLLWHGEGDGTAWPQGPCGGIPWRACGYGMWIAHKEAP
jgi:hypothetical protein